MPKVFIIHGWTYSLDKWSELVDLLKHAGIEVIQLKVPGLTAPSEKVWDIDNYLQWLHEQLQNEIKPIVIGHSNGGRIALNYAAKYPDGLGKLILVDSAGIYHGELLAKTKRAVFKTAAKIGKPLASVPLTKKVFYKLIGAKDYYKASENMKQTMQNMLAADKQLELSKVKTPVQLIWGDADKSTPLADGIKLKKQLPGSSLEIIRQAGHSPHASHASQVADIILRFVGVKTT